MASDVFKEAIFLASPEMYAGNNSGDPKKQKKFEQSLVKYYQRATTRCTPFGLFAGCSVGHIGEQTQIELAPMEDYRRCTRLDMQYLCALIQELEHMPDVRRQLTYFPNDSLYKIGGKYRYVEYHYHKSQRRHDIVSLEIDEALEQLLATAAEGATIDTLARALMDDQITKEEAEAYVNEVIDSQILKSELDPCVVGQDVLETLIEKLSGLEATPILKTLQQLQELLGRIDSRPAGTTQPIYDQIISIIKGIGVGYDAKYLFQTDLFKPVEKARVAKQTTDRLCRLIDFLAKISIPRDHSTLSNFMKSFQNRYEEMEVPLTTVLDRELGIGYPAATNSDGDVSPLINDLILPILRSQTTEMSLTPVDRILLRKYIECIRDGKRAVKLTDKDFQKLSFTHRLPDTIAVMCSLLGEEKIFVNSIGGTSGANLLGRFCHLDEDISGLVREVAEYEQEHDPDVIYAEIAHLPESRIGNIASRPALRDHTLHYLSNHGRTGKSIPVSDLMLSVRSGRLFLRSKKYDKEIVPRLTCAHNYSRSPIPVYRFLCELQNQGKTGGLHCGWSGLSSVIEYAPRIEYDDIILARERWKITEEETAGFGKLPDKELAEKLGELLQRKHIPDRVIIPDNDNELYLDLKEVKCQRLLMEHIAKRKELVLEEFLFDPEQAVVRQDGNAYTNEMIFVFHKQNHK
ncbi:lantibiotic dehydratase family protein [uncultured Alistipes sp.]|jgi:lantibiotic biosynthesis protein|uniref:lantibiotic dehydratase family protein n=1 Tax=uncultured Alistipes sp. TaxID=538949 RepID=UPI0025E17862|nr:lantibiotic dehydratase family protein [uncultured Alistipes sp.]